MIPASWCAGVTPLRTSQELVKGQVTPIKPTQVQTKGFELVLHKMSLKPIVLENRPADGDTVIEKLGHYLVGNGCLLGTKRMVRRG
jgi:hypothetical protein